jgi:hypothetical protein
VRSISGEGHRLTAAVEHGKLPPGGVWRSTDHGIQCLSRRIARLQPVRPMMPRRGSDRACDSATPASAEMNCARAPAAIDDVASTHPISPVREQSAATENVMLSLLLVS